ncbi:hypothetical protein GIB67_042211 [Kingdonia uniflora]|uniref:Uncharacterized protein n=1 Tax=Kingdonia uniflora TaxID=39325 RepID=A0A7J7LDY8_9MAGN|nr:hypothetical protein GIB67_042211 [Kingdonia uniflora]
MQVLGWIIDQVITLKKRLDGFSDDHTHMGEHLITLEGVVKGNMTTLLDQVAELSSKVSHSYHHDDADEELRPRSTVEHALKEAFECGRTCNAKAAAAVGEVLAMQLKVEGLEHGQGRGIHADVHKEIAKKGFKHHTKVWAIINSLKNQSVKVILDNDNDSSTSDH